MCHREIQVTTSCREERAAETGSANGKEKALSLGEGGRAWARSLVVPERSTEETVLMASLFLESFDSLRKVKPELVGVGGGTVGKGAGSEERGAGPLSRPEMPAQAEDPAVPRPGPPRGSTTPAPVCAEGVPSRQSRGEGCRRSARNTDVPRSEHRPDAGRAEAPRACDGGSPRTLLPPSRRPPGRDPCQGTRRREEGPAQAAAAKPGLSLRSRSRWPSWSSSRPGTAGPREPEPLPEVAVGKKTPVTNNTPGSAMCSSDHPA